MFQCNDLSRTLSCAYSERPPRGVRGDCTGKDLLDVIQSRLKMLRCRRADDISLKLRDNNLMAHASVPQKSKACLVFLAIEVPNVLLHALSLVT
jgi:hypothetical protein